SRRRVLTASAGAGLGVAILACSSNSNDGSGSSTASGAASKDRSGLLTVPKDTSGSAKPGGIWQSYRSADYVTLDPMSKIGVNVGPAMLGYSTILTYKSGSRVGNVSFVPEAAQSWEQSNDGMQ